MTRAMFLTMICESYCLENGITEEESNWKDNNETTLFCYKNEHTSKENIGTYDQL